MNRQKHSKFWNWAFSQSLTLKCALLRPLAQFENKSVKHYLTEFCIKQKNIKVFSLFTAVNNKSSGTVVDSQIWISQQIASADVWNMKIIAVEKLRTAFPLTNRFVTCCWIKFAIFSEMSEITLVLLCWILPLFSIFVDWAPWANS